MNTDIKLPCLWTFHSPQPYVGRVRDSHGMPLSGFKVQDTKNTRKVSIINNGRYMRHYRFPRHVIAPKHPMIRWMNTPMCGIPLADKKGNMIMDEDSIIKAVFEGKKPVGDVFFYHEDAKAREQFIKEIQSRGLEYFKYTRNHNAHELSFIMFGINKPLKELFNLEDIYTFYQNGTGGNLKAKSLSKKISRVEHLTPVQVLQSYDWANPKNQTEFVLTGLCLGYAFESTLAKILEK